MSSELQSLSQLFQNRLFRIPDYQRGYAWRREQLVDFWDDLVNLQANRYHYTGLLSLKAIPRSAVKTLANNDLWMIDNGYRVCHVVDGQQRLTTFAILINEIVGFVKALSCNDGRSDEEVVICYESLKDIRTKYICRRRPPQNIVTTYLFGYETDNPSADYLRYRIYGEAYSGAVNETYYTKNLKYAKEFFAECIRRLHSTEGMAGIEALYQKLTLRLMFNIHEIEDDYDVFVAFETMNNRGKKLTNLELLKNRLIYLTTLFDDAKLDDTDKEALRQQINDAWKEVYYQLGRNQHMSLEDDELLRAHWIIHFQYTRNRGDDYIRFLLSEFSPKRIFTKRTMAQIDESLTADDTDLEEDDILSLQVEPETTSVLETGEVSAYVNSLKETARFWYDSFFPADSQDLSSAEKEWLDRLNRIGIGYFRPLVVASMMPSANTSPEDRAALYKAIERFIFIGFRMGNFQSSYKSSDIYRQARDLYRGKIDVVEIIQGLNESIVKNLDYAISNFMNRIDKRFRAGDGFYGWRDLRYLLYEYEYDLATRNRIEKVSWDLFTKAERDRITIEHILPQTPTNTYWRQQFHSFTDEEIKLLSATLGNLLLLAQSINSSLQNDSFIDKKTSAVGRYRGYENGSHSEIEISREADWDAERILGRGLRLLRFMEKRWQFIFAGEEQMVQLLHLQFLHTPRAKEADPISITSSPSELDPIEDDRDPASEAEEKEEEDRHRLRREFWTGLLKVVNAKTGLFQGVNPTKDNTVGAASGLNGVRYQLRIRMQDAALQLVFDRRSKELNRNTFAYFYSRRAKIEGAFRHAIKWCPPDDRTLCRAEFMITTCGLADRCTWENGQVEIAEKLVAWEKAFNPLIRQATEISELA